MNREKYSKNIRKIFLNKLRRNIASIKSRFIQMDNEGRKKIGKEEIKKESGKLEEKGKY